MGDSKIKNCATIFLFIFMTGCGSTLCTKGKTKQGLFFNYGSTIGIDHVDIGGEPTHKRSDSWVKIIIVKKEGFLLVTSQGVVHCDNMDEIRKNIYAPCKGHKIVKEYKIRRYIKKRGYEEWKYDVIPKSEWELVKDIDFKFSKKPTYYYENCRYRFLGGFYQLLQFISRA